MCARKDISMALSNSLLLEGFPSFSFAGGDKGLTSNKVRTTIAASFTAKHLTHCYRNSDSSGEYLRQLLTPTNQQIGTTFMLKMYW